MNTDEYLEHKRREFLTEFNIPADYRMPEPEWENADPSKILVLSDPHEPYGHEGVYQMVEEKEKDAGILVVPGDMGDYYSKSRFKKRKRVRFEDEIRAVFYRIEWMSKHWRDVRIMLGNHDNRPEKKIQDLLVNDPDLLIMTEANLLTFLCSFFPNVEVVGQQLDGTQINLTHFYQLGDIVFTHGELSRVQKTATLDYISRYLHNWGHLINLGPFRVIAQGHNHHDLKTTYGREYWFMLPTCSDPFSTGMEYVYQPRMVPREPPSVGYSVFFQENRHTDFNASHNVILDYYGNNTRQKT